jgi:hypothetical protein
MATVGASTVRGRSRAQFAVDGGMDVVAAVQRLPMALPQFRLTRSSGLRAEFARRMNWATWGETVVLDWQFDMGSALISVQVEPKLSTTVIDWGQGARDIEAIVGYFRRAATSTGVG